MSLAAVEAPAVGEPRDGALALRLDEAEFSAFYEAVAPRLWSYLYFATRDRSAADDLAQEAFARVLASSFRPESEEHLRRYLYRTATNLVADRRRRAPRTPLPLDDFEPSAPSATPGLRIDFERALAGLKPKDRRLLYLAHVEEMDHRALAEAVGASPASVRVMLFRARRRLAQALGRESAPERSPA